MERNECLFYLEDLVDKQNTILKKLRLYSQQLIEKIETMLQKKYEFNQDIRIENEVLRMRLSNAYERLEQTDKQLLEHQDTHTRLKQRIIHLNDKVKAYEDIARHC